MYSNISSHCLLELPLNIWVMSHYPGCYHSTLWSQNGDNFARSMSYLLHLHYLIDRITKNTLLMWQVRETVTLHCLNLGGSMKLSFQWAMFLLNTDLGPRTKYKIVHVQPIDLWTISNIDCNGSAFSMTETSWTMPFTFSGMNYCTVRCSMILII